MLLAAINRKTKLKLMIEEGFMANWEPRGTVDCTDGYNDVMSPFLSICLPFYTQCWLLPRASFLVIVGRLAAIRPADCLIPTK